MLNDVITKFNHTRWMKWTMQVITYIAICAFFTCLHITKAEVSVLSMDEQLKRLFAEFKRCEKTMAEDRYTLTGPYCNRTWDNILCWPDTPAGYVAKQPCPEYINKFDQGEYVTRLCTHNGTWWVNPGTHQPWTNYTACEKSSNNFVPQLIQDHMQGIKLMYTIGYSLSLTALILALIIMVYFKRLHCPRNIIHMNMFLAFGVRAAFSLMRTILLVNDLGFSIDVNQTLPDVTFVKDGYHWECKLFFTLFYYIIFASVMWLFNEGLYLQLILSISVFSDKTKVRWFVLLGWGFPLLFVLPWVICRVYLDDMLCWNVHVYRTLYWIIHGPMVASVAINFVIFVNTVRMLFTKLRASNCPDSKMRRYRRLAKSTLILIPLFAVYYMIFLLLPDDVNTTVDLFKMYVEMLFNSFQGFLVALLFCFLNHEVQSEITTKWRRRSLQKTGSRSTTMFHHSYFHHFSSRQNNQPHDHAGRLDNNDGKDRKIIKTFPAIPEEQATITQVPEPPALKDSPRTLHKDFAHTDKIMQPLFVESHPCPKSPLLDFDHDPNSKDSVQADDVMKPLIIESRQCAESEYLEHNNLSHKIAQTDGGVWESNVNTPPHHFSDCSELVTSNSFSNHTREPLIISNKNNEACDRSVPFYEPFHKSSSSVCFPSIYDNEPDKCAVLCISDNQTNSPRTNCSSELVVQKEHKNTSSTILPNNCFCSSINNMKFNHGLLLPICKESCVSSKELGAPLVFLCIDLDDKVASFAHWWERSGAVTYFAARNPARLTPPQIY